MLGFGNTAQQRGLYRQSTRAHHIEANEVAVNKVTFSDGTEQTTGGGQVLAFASVPNLDGGPSSLTHNTETSVVVCKPATTPDLTSYQQSYVRTKTSTTVILEL